MGNPLAPTLANFFMGTQENNYFNADNENNPVLYCRYVDDIFCIFRKDVVFNNFHGRLKNLHRSITFTYELGGDKLPLLDVKIKLADKIESKVYKKEVDTDVVLNFSSIAPLKWKRSLVLWFLNRAKKLSSNNTIYNKEVLK